MTMPNVIYNGPGNWPDADKLMANYNYLENLAVGNTTFKNRLINGAMKIDQRNAGASVTQNTTGVYPADRWLLLGNVASKLTGQKIVGSSPPPGFDSYIKITSASAYSAGAGEYFTLSQAIEGFNICDFCFGSVSAKYLTLSFLVRSSLTGNFSGSIQNSGHTRSYPFQYSISAANTWEYKTVTFSGEQTGTWLTDNGAGLLLIFDMGSGTNYLGGGIGWNVNDYRGISGSVPLVGTNAATWSLTGVQLEVGTLATSFETRDIGRELDLCRRYYEKSYDQGTIPGTATPASGISFRANGTSHIHDVALRVIKRANPTVTLYSSSTGSSGAWRDTDNNADRTAGADYIGDNRFRVGLTATVNTASMCGHFTASAEL